MRDGEPDRRVNGVELVRPGDRRGGSHLSASFSIFLPAVARARTTTSLCRAAEKLNCGITAAACVPGRCLITGAGEVDVDPLEDVEAQVALLATQIRDAEVGPGSDISGRQVADGEWRGREVFGGLAAHEVPPTEPSGTDAVAILMSAEPPSHTAVEVSRSRNGSRRSSARRTSSRSALRKRAGRIVAAGREHEPVAR